MPNGNSLVEYEFDGKYFVEYYLEKVSFYNARTKEYKVPGETIWIADKDTKLLIAKDGLISGFDKKDIKKFYKYLNGPFLTSILFHEEKMKKKTLNSGFNANDKARMNDNLYELLLDTKKKIMDANIDEKSKTKLLNEINCLAESYYHELNEYYNSTVTLSLINADAIRRKYIKLIAVLEMELIDYNQKMKNELNKDYILFKKKIR